MTDAPIQKSRDNFEQDQFLSILSREDALARKISSSVGIADIALLKKSDGAWLPLAIGDLSLDHIVRADAWFAVPGSSEGFAAGTLVDAYMLRT